MIAKVNTLILTEELKRQASAPMIFTCDDFNIYYVKYILAPGEHDFLVYEMVCSGLAKYFKIFTPEIALVNVTADYSASLTRNKHFFSAGVVAFGSKFIGTNDHMDNTGKFKLNSQHDLNRYHHPLMLFRTAIFDIHINNVDRHEDNYNILVKTGIKKTFYAIDHFAAFGGSLGKGKFRAQNPLNINQKLIKSEVIRQLLQFYGTEKIEREIDNYLYLCNNSVANIVQEYMTYIPESWGLSERLEERIVSFLLDESRNRLVKKEILEYIYYLKRG